MVAMPEGVSGGIALMTLDEFVQLTNLIKDVTTTKGAPSGHSGGVVVPCPG